MKRDEKDALKKAFNIPEPVRRDEFIAEYEESIKKTERRPRLTVITRYAATAAAAAVIIAVGGKVMMSPNFADKFTNIQNNEPTTAVTTASDDDAAVTSSAETAVMDTLTTAADNNAVSTAEPSPSNTEAKKTSTTKKSKETSAPKKTTAAKKTDVPKKTTAADENDPPKTTVTVPPDDTNAIPTTADPGTQAPPPIDDPPPIAPLPHDYTVEAPRHYYKTGSVALLKNYVDRIFIEPEECDTDYLWENADSMVQVSIIDITYTDAYYEPFTKLDVVILNTYGGDHANYDRISVYVPGGFISVEGAEELYGVDIDLPESYCLYHNGGRKEIFKEQQNYFLFLKKGTSHVPDGAYELLTLSDYSVFKYNSETRVYECAADSEMTLDIR